MVVIFSHPKVREFLMKNGIVYTFRKMNPKTFNGIRHKIGNDWATNQRGGKKIMDVKITPMQRITSVQEAHILRKYVSKSGFRTVRDWTLAIRELNPRYTICGWVYKVIKNE